jgi:hypothetical protein
VKGLSSHCQCNARYRFRAPRYRIFKLSPTLTQITARVWRRSSVQPAAQRMCILSHQIPYHSQTMHFHTRHAGSNTSYLVLLCCCSVTAIPRQWCVPSPAFPCPLPRFGHLATLGTCRRRRPTLRKRGRLTIHTSTCEFDSVVYYCDSAPTRHPFLLRSFRHSHPSYSSGRVSEHGRSLHPQPALLQLSPRVL